jgi:hypothetical protein
MDLSTLLFFVLVLVIIIICYLAYAKGKFNKPSKLHFVFAGCATVFPLIDIVQTWAALQIGAEGNPLLLYFLSGLPAELGWLLFVLAHFAFAVFGLYLGWKGKTEKGADERTLAAFFGSLWTVLVIWNFAFMIMYGVI